MTRPTVNFAAERAAAEAADPLQFVTVTGGLTLPLPAINLAVDLEFRGIVLAVDEAHELVVPDDPRLTAADRAAIHRWRRHLVAILLTPCPAVGVSQSSRRERADRRRSTAAGRRVSGAEARHESSSTTYWKR